MAAKRSAENLKQDLDEQTFLVAALKENIVQLVSANAELQRQLQAYSLPNDASTSPSLEISDERVLVLEASNRQLKRELEDTLANLAAMRSEKRDELASATALDKEVKRLNAKLHEEALRVSSFSNVEQQFHDAEMQRDALQATLTKTSDELDLLRDQIGKVKHEAAQESSLLQQEMNQVASRLADATIELKSARDEVSSCTSDRATALEQIEQLQAEMAILRQQSQQKDQASDVATTAEQLRSAEQKLHSAEERASTAEQKLQSAEERASTAEQKLQSDGSLRIQIEALQNELTVAKEQVVPIYVSHVVSQGRE
eukprot:TRINITY_DN2882_c0_g2_i1.p2 TRINITY_DN2882_c0_g2~~TRINITY_DN2882_c0_g2_i1.p2  ORF type:complete len:315 (-),score=94.24 TRINITY_DN2882_c0_g2_i1:594-1538(-)